MGLRMSSPHVAAAAATPLGIGAFRNVRLSRLNYIHVAEYRIQVGISTLWAFDELLFPLAHFCHYVEFFSAVFAFQIIKRHCHYLRKYILFYSNYYYIIMTGHK